MIYIICYAFYFICLLESLCRMSRGVSEPASVGSPHSVYRIAGERAEGPALTVNAVKIKTILERGSKCELQDGFAIS